MIKLASAVRPTLVAGAPLDNASAVAQSVYWESVDQLWYVCQLDSTAADQTRLIVSRYTVDGVPKDKMFVEEAGHGANLGVERSGSGTYLWTDALPSGGWATGIARIPYVAGSTVRTTDPSTATFKPRTGVHRVSATIDPTRRHLIYRWQSNDVSSGSAVGGFDRYDLAAAAGGTYTPLQTVAFGASGKTLQGYTSLGDYVYQFYGQQEVDNATVTCTDWASGTLLQSQLITDFAGLNNREPEGMCVYESVPGDPAATVAFAIAAKPATGRQINIARFPAAGTNPWVEIPYDTALYSPNSANYAPQFRIAGDQVYVHFSMAKVDGTAWSLGEKLFQLPLRARPNRTQRLLGVVTGSAVSADVNAIRLEATSDGDVSFLDERTLVGWIGADVSFWLC